MTTIDSRSLLAMRAQILEQNSALQRAAGLAQTGETDSAKSTGFGDAFKTAIAEVNSLQSQSAAATEAYERGETTDIAAVMLARQQASIGFEATLQVRNKLLAAYKDIMSMPV
jgi:flagellar hook-basal body complex protein FliE